MKDIFSNVNLLEIFDEVDETLKPMEYRDALRTPYGNPDLMTKPQRKGWEFLQDRSGNGPQIAFIAAKGGSKTHFGAAFAIHQVQTFPNSLGVIISNTYEQALRNAGELLIKVAKAVDFEVEFFKNKKIDGQQYTSVYQVRMPNGKSAHILVRSFDAVNKLEGANLDWGWAEEIQDASWEEFKVFYSRVIRGEKADNAMFLAGMTGDAFHWMYQKLPQLGFVEEEKFDPEKDNGIMLEFSIYENKVNLGEKRIAQTIAAYGEDHPFITGERVSTNRNRAFHRYRDARHRLGLMSELLTDYDPTRELILVIDFNVSPMTYVVFQEKPYNDDWDDPHVYRKEDGSVEVITNEGEIEEYPSLEAYKPANRMVLAQIDEWEEWNSGTRQAMENFVSVYSEHVNGLSVFGDRTGDSDKSSSDVTDWDIIRSALSGFPNVHIQQGVKMKHNHKTGKITYSNPSVKASVNVMNHYLLRDKICFLPESKYESGGMAASIAMTESDPTGGIDKSNDRKKMEDKSIPRSHYTDEGRYLVVWHNGGEQLLEQQEYEDSLTDAISDLVQHSNNNIMSQHSAFF